MNGIQFGVEGEARVAESATKSYSYSCGVIAFCWCKLKIVGPCAELCSAILASEGTFMRLRT